MSTRIEKFKVINDRQVAKYGKPLTIVIEKYNGKESAFLSHNMFPITKNYLDYTHTRNGTPVPVKHSLNQQIKSNMKGKASSIPRRKTIGKAYA